MGISINGPSGIDTKTIIDTLVGIEDQKVTKIENAKETDQLKIDAYSKVASLLSDIKTKAAALSTTSSFDLFKSTSSNDKAVTVEGGTGCVDGQYDVKVFQLAANEKMISTDGAITSQTASLSSLGFAIGTIKVDNVDIAIDADDTIQDLRMKINNATNIKGEKLGVSASVVKISDTNYRLVLGAKNTGSAGIAYSDVSGDILEKLGIIKDAAGDKGNIKQVIKSTNSMQTAFSSLLTGDSIQYTGTDHNGNSVANTFIKSDSNTIDDFLAQVKSSYFGTVDVSIDNAGSLVIEDKTSGTSKLSMGVLTADSIAQDVTISTVGKEGTGVLSTGKDSYLSVENIFMNNSSNSVTGTFTGVTFNLHNISADTAATLTLKRDSDAVQKNFQGLIDSYNALLTYAKSATGHKDPNKKDSTDGDLAGDSTLMSIVSQVRAQMKQEFGLFGSAGKYTNLTMFGMQTDVSTGQLNLDSTKFKKGFDTHYDDMMKVFTSIGVSDNTSVIMGRNSVDTKSGIYQLEEVDANHLRIKLSGDTDWYTSDARFGDIISFSDGPAKGLTLTAPSGIIPATGSTFTMSKGLGTLLNETITKLNDTHSGIISLRQDSWRKSMTTKDQRITKLQAQNEAYRARLTSQYSAMEQAMSTLQSQTASIISNLSNNS